MKGKRGFRAVSAALAAFLCCGGCGQASPPAEETTKIFLSETELFLEEGESFRLTVTFVPAPARGIPVEWRVSDGSVASVDGGVVTAKGEGETIVTAYTGENTAGCKVTVSAPGGR